tara:strand:- start:34 stop:516 length:483 start_codon:yes stop_codon:yes gene_type:complete
MEMTTRPTIPFQQATAIVLTCLALTMNAHSASDKIVFDFTTATNSSAWQIVNDDVMGGVSTSRFQILTNGAVFSGVVSLENNGGFASVRSLPAKKNSRASTPSCCGCAAMVIATNLRCGPKAVSTRRFTNTNALSRRNVTSGKNTGCRSRTSCRPFADEC